MTAGAGRSRVVFMGSPAFAATFPSYVGSPAAVLAGTGVQLDAGTPADADDTWWIPSAMGGTAPTLEQAEADDAEVRAARAARRAARSD